MLIVISFSVYRWFVYMSKLQQKKIVKPNECNSTDGKFCEQIELVITSSSVDTREMWNIKCFSSNLQSAGINIYISNFKENFKEII